MSETMTQVDRLLPVAKRELKKRTYMKSYKLARILKLDGQSGIVIAGKILAKLPEWEPDRCQSVRRTWINTEVKKRRQQEIEGEIWRRLFHPVETSDTETYRELIEMLLPNGDCPKFPTCTHPDKDNYYCHGFCPWIPSLDTWLEELDELRGRIG